MFLQHHCHVTHWYYQSNCLERKYGSDLLIHTPMSLKEENWVHISQYIYYHTVMYYVHYKIYKKENKMKNIQIEALMFSFCSPIEYMQWMNSCMKGYTIAPLATSVFHLIPQTTCSSTFQSCWTSLWFPKHNWLFGFYFLCVCILFLEILPCIYLLANFSSPS